MYVAAIRHCACVHRGFTLLEVLVALTIVTLAIGAVVSQAASLNRNGVHLSDKTFALWVAQNRLGELELGAVPPAVADTRGEAALGGRTWFWRQRVSTVGGDAALRRIDVLVFDRPPGSGALGAKERALVDLTGFMAVEQGG